MSGLGGHVADYLALRRALGFKLRRHEIELAQLVSFCEVAGATTLTADLAIGWARLPEGVQPTRWTFRLSVARGFARYLASIDPATEVPPPDVFGRGPGRPVPYLYSDTELRRLFDAAASLRPALRAATLTTVLGLLVATGMRVGEVLGLSPADADLAAGVLTATATKGDRPRLVPLHPSTTAALASYAALRHQHYPDATAFFVSAVGTPLAYSTLVHTFNDLATATGVRTVSRRPRLHDFRHRFAVRVLIDAYRSGADVQARMAVLSTYLGHVDPKGTYWYLSAAPELLELAAARLAGNPGGRL